MNEKQLSDGILEIILEKQYDYLYMYYIKLHKEKKVIGFINLKTKDSDETKTTGHIGYGIYPPYRGHYYAAKACLLIKQVALSQGLKVLTIITTSDNIPSQKTCEKIGAKLISTERTYRYQWILD